MDSDDLKNEFVTMQRQSKSFQSRKSGTVTTVIVGGNDSVSESDNSMIS